MSASQLIENFDLLSQAPESFRCLRRFIMDLAIRGKLSAQDPEDEPASALLKRMLIEKQQSSKNKTENKKIDIPAEYEAEPFELPPSWVWASIGEVSRYGSPEKVTSNSSISDDTWVLDLEDIEKNTSRLLNKISSSSRVFKSTKSCFKEGDVLFGKLRPYLSKVLVADQDGVCTTEIIPIKGYAGLVPEYTKIVLQSSLTMTKVNQLMYGVKMPRLGTGDANALRFPLPPLAEQHRIVKKANELVALCDQLSAAESECLHYSEVLAEVCLKIPSTFEITSNSEVPHGKSSIYIQNFSRLTRSFDQIKLLREAIIDYAIRGRLVSQEHTDISAAMFLDKVHLEIEAYGKANRIPTPIVEPINKQDMPFQLPKGWEWQRLARVCRVITDGDHLPPPKSVDGIAFLTIGNISGGSLNFTDCRFVPDSYYDNIMAYRRPEQGDLLYTVVGASYGRPIIVNSSRLFCVQRHIAIIKPATQISRQYLHLVLSSSFLYDQATRSLTGTAQPTVPLRPLRNFLIPIPPIAEQSRIVAKHEELKFLCDELESQLAITQSSSQQMLERLIENTLGMPAPQFEADIKKSIDKLRIENYQAEGTSKFMTSNPVTNVEQLVECVRDLGGRTTPERLLVGSGLSDDLETFYDLLRMARDSGALSIPLGSDAKIVGTDNAN